MVNNLNMINKQKIKYKQWLFISNGYTEAMVTYSEATKIKRFRNMAMFKI